MSESGGGFLGEPQNFEKRQGHWKTGWTDVNPICCYLVGYPINRVDERLPWVIAAEKPAEDRLAA